MKQFTLTLIFITISLFGSFGQGFKIDESKPLNNQIEEWLLSTQRDSTDKTCQQLLTDFYNSFESDEDQPNSLYISAMVNHYKYLDDLNLPNRQIVILLYYYQINPSEKPENALIWIKALEKEYQNIYGQTHPLIYLFKGLSLINIGQIPEAHAVFIEFQKNYPESVTAMCCLYETEPDKIRADSLLRILKANHPNHWMLKQTFEKKD